MSKIDQFLSLTDRLLSLVNSDQFLSAEQKTKLSRFISDIGADVKAGSLISIETRLYIARNTFLEWRRESPLLKLTSKFSHCSA